MWNQTWRRIRIVSKSAMTRLLLAAAGCMIVYPLSYAPLYRATQVPNPVAVNLWSGPCGIFRPVVAWHMDSTWLREPLMVWASLWGVREDFEFHSDTQLFIRELKQKI